MSVSPEYDYLLHLLKIAIPVEVRALVATQMKSAVQDNKPILLEQQTILDSDEPAPHIDHHIHAKKSVELTTEVIDNFFEHFPEIRWILSCCAFMIANYLLHDARDKDSVPKVDENILRDRMDLDQLVSSILLVLYANTGDINQAIEILDLMLYDLFAEEFMIFPEVDEMTEKVEQIPTGVSKVEYYQQSQNGSNLVVITTPRKDLNRNLPDGNLCWQEVMERITRKYSVTHAFSITIQQPEVPHSQTRNKIQYPQGNVVLSLTGIWNKDDSQSIDQITDLASKFSDFALNFIQFARKWINERNLQEHLELHIAPGARNAFVRIQLIPTDSTKLVPGHGAYSEIIGEIVSDFIIDQRLGDPIRSEVFRQ